MKVGLFHTVQLPDPGKQAEYYRGALEQVRRAEDLGFESVWFTERFEHLKVLDPWSSSPSR